MESSASNKGFTLLEPLLASALLGFITLGIISGLAFAQQNTALATSHEEAVARAEEGIEAVQSLRDSGTLTFDSGVYGIEEIGGKWHLIPSHDTADGYTRTITLTTTDAHTLTVLSSVSWDMFGFSQSVEMETIITNWRI